MNQGFPVPPFQQPNEFQKARFPNYTNSFQGGGSIPSYAQPNQSAFGTPAAAPVQSAFSAFSGTPASSAPFQPKFGQSGSSLPFGAALNLSQQSAFTDKSQPTLPAFGKQSFANSAFASSAFADPPPAPAASAFTGIDFRTNPIGSGNAFPVPEQGSGQLNDGEKRDGKRDKKAQKNEAKKRESKKAGKPSKGSGAAGGSGSTETSGPQPRSRTPLTPPVFQATRFVSRARPASNDMAILKPLPKPLTSVVFNPDPWDTENQARMKAIEQDYLVNRISLQTAYDILAPMRKTERQELEKRGLVDSTEHRKDLSDATVFVGSCEDMCPVFERVRRAHENNVLNLEKDGNGRASRDLAIKAFSRPAAGQPPPLPSDVRPPHVLVTTLHYIVTDVVPKLPQSHALIWDRTRSIRQDFTYQNYQGPEAIYCFEVIARIHCFCLHVMAKSAATDGTEWSQQQELEQFNKCLQSLAEFYEITPSHNQAEMCSYHLMSHFFDNELLASIDRLQPEVSRHPLVNLAIELRSLAKSSVPLFFKRVRQPDVPATIRAIAEVHFNDIRIRMVRSLVSSLHRQINMYSMRRFSALLGFETLDEARQFCEHYDLNVSTNDENGEEIDLKTWIEANVKDKQSMRQAFDLSLDHPIHQQDLLQPVGPPIPLRQPEDHSVTFPQPVQKPIVAQTAFQQPPSTSKSGPQERLDQIRAQEQALRDRQKADQERQRAQQAETQLRQETQRQEAIERERAQQEALRQEQLRHEEEERQRQMAAQREKLHQQRRLQEQKRLEQEKERQIQILREEELRLRQKRAELVSMRSSFIHELSSQIFDRLTGDVPGRESADIIRSVNLSQRLLLRRVCHRVKLVAERCLDTERKRQSRIEELKLFRQKRGRVVSHHLRRSDIYGASDDSVPSRPQSSYRRYVSGAASPPDHGTDTGTSVDDDVTAATSETNLETSPNKLVKTLDVNSVKHWLVQAMSTGLQQLTVSCDVNTVQGKWLYDVLRVDQRTEILPREFFTISGTPAVSGSDIAIIGTGGRPVPSAIMSLSFTGMSLSELAKSLNLAFAEFVEMQQKTLSSMRSLTKRRRISSVREMTPPTPATSASLDVDSRRRSSEAATATEQRLREAIARAKKLVQD